MSPSDSVHYHEDYKGVFHRCYHKCRGFLTNWKFWFAVTGSFPFEHLLWERAWPFRLLTKWLGI